MAASIDESSSCCVCFRKITGSVVQCLKNHTFCEHCSAKQPNCRICQLPLTVSKNVQLEKLLQKLDFSKLKSDCTYAHLGCKGSPYIDALESHVRECRFREFQCEGKLFCNWKCSWTGHFEDLLQHFKTTHPCDSNWHYKYDCSIPIDLRKDIKDIKIIDFSNGKQIFWCKHKIDVVKKNCYWLFQCIGTQEYATNYFYEFEIYLGKVRKLKVTDVCHSDSEDADDIFDSERCVCVSFQTISSFMENGNRVSFRFRIMKDKEITQSRPVSHTPIVPFAQSVPPGPLRPTMPPSPRPLIPIPPRPLMPVPPRPLMPVPPRALMPVPPRPLMPVVPRPLMPPPLRPHGFGNAPRHPSLGNMKPVALRTSPKLKQKSNLKTGDTKKNRKYYNSEN